MKKQGFSSGKATTDLGSTQESRERRGSEPIGGKAGMEMLGGPAMARLRNWRWQTTGGQNQRKNETKGDRICFKPKKGVMKGQSGAARV